MIMININRTDEECFNRVYRGLRRKDIKKYKNLPIKEIRYMDNQYRIYDARKNWDKVRKSFMR